MRFININNVLPNLPPAVVAALANKHQELVNGSDAIKTSVIAAGNATWAQVKLTFENSSNRKCWYTESKNPGCVNDVDHFRPKGRMNDDAGNLKFWYWFIAFDPENYRLSCQFANRPNVNQLLNGTGGKHQHFPLLNNQAHAATKATIVNELPVILDPCVETDCNLIQFQPDGRPVVAQAHAANPVAKMRVEQSNLLLNLDYPTFNEDREQLYNKIKKLVLRGDGYRINNNPALADVQNDLRELMRPGAEYSKAAECFVRCFRDREWIEGILP
jgi:hypothetical protein